MGLDTIDPELVESHLGEAGPTLTVLLARFGVPLGLVMIERLVGLKGPVRLRPAGVGMLAPLLAYVKSCKN